MVYLPRAQVWLTPPDSQKVPMHRTSVLLCYQENNFYVYPVFLCSLYAAIFQQTKREQEINGRWLFFSPACSSTHVYACARIHRFKMDSPFQNGCTGDVLKMRPPGRGGDWLPRGQKKSEIPTPRGGDFPPGGGDFGKNDGPGAHFQNVTGAAILKRWIHFETVNPSRMRKSITQLKPKILPTVLSIWTVQYVIETTILNRNK